MTDQWAVSKNIDLAAEYLQKDFDKLARLCANWRIKLNPEKTKVIIFSRFKNAVRAEPALSLYCDLLSYYPHIKFLGITFNNRVTFIKYFEEILLRCKPQISSLKDIGQQKVRSKSRNYFTDLQTICQTNIRIWNCFYLNFPDTVIDKIQRVQNSFIRLSLRLPKYVSARLIHEASGLPYVRERLSTVDQNHLARMHANPLAEHIINPDGH